MERRYAIKIGVEVDEEIRIWDNAPNEITALKWTENEIKEELAGLDIPYNLKLKIVDVKDLDKEQKKLITHRKRLLSWG